MTFNFQKKFQKTRFAPSPTGFLHRGHILSAIWVWGIGKITDASVHLRIEDHDISRCREAHVEAIRADLLWLGFQWDSESRQTEHNSRFELELRNLSHLYACDCTRKELAGETRYKGYCRQRSLPIHGQEAYGLRCELPTEWITWSDLRLGTFTECPQEQCGDLLLRDRQGQWTYQYAVCVDDWKEGIDLVIRGEDLLDSTARQIQLAALLGRPEPAQYLHHPLLYDADGLKLSKRQLSKSIASERAEGITPELLLGDVCFEGRLIAERREVTQSEIPGLIDRVISPY